MLENGMEGQWSMEVVKVTYGFIIWKSISKMWPEYLVRTEHSLGNGRTIPFWYDMWIGRTPLNDQSLDLSS